MIRKYKIYIIMGITVLLLLWFTGRYEGRLGNPLGHYSGRRRE